MPVTHKVALIVLFIGALLALRPVCAFIADTGGWPATAAWCAGCYAIARRIGP